MSDDGLAVVVAGVDTVIVGPLVLMVVGVILKGAFDGEDELILLDGCWVGTFGSCVDDGMMLVLVVVVVVVGGEEMMVNLLLGSAVDDEDGLVVALVGACDGLVDVDESGPFVGFDDGEDEEVVVVGVGVL